MFMCIFVCIYVFSHMCLCVKTFGDFEEQFLIEEREVI